MKEFWHRNIAKQLVGGDGSKEKVLKLHQSKSVPPSHRELDWPNGRNFSTSTGLERLPTKTLYGKSNLGTTSRQPTSAANCCQWALTIFHYLYKAYSLPSPGLWRVPIKITWLFSVLKIGNDSSKTEEGIFAKIRSIYINYLKIQNVTVQMHTQDLSLMLKTTFFFKWAENSHL